MGIKVAKFGGTSLADAKQIRKVQKLICADEERSYVVPSAPGKRTSSDRKITDLLYLCHAHVQHNVPIDEVFQIIAERYLDIVSDLGVSIDMEPYFDDIKKRFQAERPPITQRAGGNSSQGIFLPIYSAMILWTLSK